MLKPLLDVAATAELLGTTERHVRELVYRRSIPHMHVGRLVRFHPDELERWLSDNSVSEVPSAAGVGSRPRSSAWNDGGEHP